MSIIITPATITNQQMSADANNYDLQISKTSGGCPFAKSHQDQQNMLRT